MGSLALEKLEVFRMSEQLADAVWTMVNSWNNFAKDTVGKQLVRAADSIGANIAEGYGRGSYQDNRRFVRISRGSWYETRFWLRRAHTRGLLDPAVVRSIRPVMNRLGPMLNGYLRSIGTQREPNDK